MTDILKEFCFETKQEAENYADKIVDRKTNIEYVSWMDAWVVEVY